jgi:magnesium chelatase family protein
MSFAALSSRALVGMQALPVTVEVHLANGLPSFTLVGLADTEVKEARERVRAAIHNSALAFPHNKRITVSLAPADLPKDSGRFDLPIALGILAASGQLDAAALARHEFAGELSLSGDLRAVRGALAMAAALRGEGQGRTLVLPAACAHEAALVPDVDARAATHLAQVVQALQPGETAHGLPRARAEGLGASGEAGALPSALPSALPHAATPAGLDLRDVRGQAAAKRALEIAAAGGHSLLMVGPPGSGKSMLAERLIGLLPPLDDDEALASAAVWSLRGPFDAAQWRRRRQRSPHHSASPVALVGGGSPPLPGEVSLAHQGILFLDELPEFPRAALEALREPMENGRVTISRAARQAEFPAVFQLVAAMNPCPCGYLGAAARACRCTPDAVARYQARLSGPLLDRIDLQVDVQPVPPEVLADADAGAEPSAAVAARVDLARARQRARQGKLNAHLDADALARHAGASRAAEELLRLAAQRLAWSARAYHRVLRVARSVADLAGSATIETAHVAEAIQLRRALVGAGI